MTAQTPIYGIKYPVVGEPIRTTRQVLEDNAKAIEAALQSRGVAATNAADLLTLQGQVNLLPKGRRASLRPSTTGPDLITAETLFDPVTFTAEAGRRYTIDADLTWVANTALTTAQFRVRYATGAAGTTPVLSTASTEADQWLIRSWAIGEFIHDRLTTELVGLPAGAVTVGLSVARAAGTGTLSIVGTAAVRRALIVEDIGT